MKVSELLADESKWTQNASARDAEGRLCHVDSPKACRWCLWGALCYCYDRDFESFDRYCNDLNGMISDERYPESGFVTFSDWNDVPERTFAEVKALVEKAGI